MKVSRLPLLEEETSTYVQTRCYLLHTMQLWTYIRETGRCLSVRISEHKRAVQQLDKRYALAADHMDHQILWEESTAPSRNMKPTGTEGRLRKHLDKANGQRSEHGLRSLTQSNVEHDAVQINQQRRDWVSE